MKNLLVPAAVFLLSIASAESSEQVKVPPCAALEAWAARVNAADTFLVAPKLALPKAFEDSALVPVFGVSALAWAPEDVQAVSRGLVACYNEAGKRRDAAAAAALGNANRSVAGQVPPVNAALKKAKGDADIARQQIDSLQDSADLGNALGILLHANPAAPDGNAYRSIPRPVAEPIWRLAIAVPNLADGERAPVYKALGERAGKIQASLTGDAEKAIAGASEDAAGVIAVMEVRQKLSEIADADAKAKLAQSADERARHIRETLRQATPAAWVPPSCLDLYRWSSAPNATTGIGIAGHGVMTAFLDERTVPVFGVGVSAWSDADLAHFKTLRGLCQRAAQPQPGAAPDAELSQAAARGRWIDGADPQIAEARTTMVAYHKAQQDLAAAYAKINALPDVAQSLLPLAQIAADPVQYAVTPDERTKFVNAINSKRAAIGTHATEAAVKGLDTVKVASLADLPKFFTYIAQNTPMIPDPRGQQAFAAAANNALQEGMTRVLPEFQAKLDAIPVNLDGAAQANDAVAKLTGVPDPSRLPTFKPLFDAAHARSEAIRKSVHDQACADLLSREGVGSDAKLDVWDGEKGMSLGDFICGLAYHGYTINGYSGAGLISSTYTLKVTGIKEAIETISMHKAEVQAGKQMLVGFKIVDQNGMQISIIGAEGDAKGAAAVSIMGWEFFSREAKGRGVLEAQACESVVASPPKPGAEATLFRMECQSMHIVPKTAGAR